MKRSRWLVFIAVVLLGSCHPHTNEEKKAAPHPGEAWLTAAQLSELKIEIADVDEQSVDDSLMASGSVTFDDSRVAHIFSPVNGRVTRIDGELGQRVKKGAALAVLESPDIGMASSDLGKAHADLTAAEHDFARQKELFASHASSQKDYELAEDSFHKAKAEMDRARAKASLFRTSGGGDVTQGYALRTGIDGEIIARKVSLGAEVQGLYGGGQADELFTVGELDRVWVVANVFEMDIARVRLGARAEVRVIAYPNKTFEGKVDYIAGTLEKDTRTARVRCTFDNPEKLLKPEMFANVRIHVDERREIAILRDSIVRLGDQQFVFMYRGDTADGKKRFERVPVDLDEGEGEKWIPVRGKLEKGSKIVTSGAILISGMY